MLSLKVFVTFLKTYSNRHLAFPDSVAHSCSCHEEAFPSLFSMSPPLSLMDSGLLCRPHSTDYDMRPGQVAITV